MAGGAYISADIGKIAKFESDSETAIAEFNAIKLKFEGVNSGLLGKWKGKGANMYKRETDHILENIGSIEDVLNNLNNGIVKDIKEAYLSLDEALDEFNRNPQAEEGATE
ncbi:MAG: hypothetical protein LBG81_03765 [Coriobacteriaceae bacterium]|jgi:uncharacterized protein YukE|nr:hypothetical protein [Coriobacteriaceae bacterium]